MHANYLKECGNEIWASWHSIIVMYIQNRHNHEVWTLFYEMLRDGFVPNQVVLIKAIKVGLSSASLE